jgi:phosphoribosyl 1,2-cyclic phosphate phosphodiesterase
MNIKITFLGTGTSQGIPVINCNHPVCLSNDKRDNRLRTSVLVEWDNYCYVIDCGPDFRYQMLRAKVSKIDGVLFTHEHADHTAGLDDIRPFSFQMGAVPIYANKRVIENLTKRFDYIFVDKNKYPGAPSVIVNEVTNAPFFLNNLKIIPIESFHNKITVLGFRFENIAYLTDVKTIAEKELQKLVNLDILIINALRIKPHKSHLNLEEALDIVNKLKPKKAYLTHISYLMGFYADVEKILPKNVFLAYDGLVV